MKWYNNLKIRTKLLSVFIFLAVLSASVSFISYLQAQALSKSNTLMYKEIVVPLEDLSGLTTTFQQIKVSLREIVILNDEKQIHLKQNEIIELRKLFVQKLEKIGDEISTDDAELRGSYDNLMQVRQSYIPYIDQIITLALRNQDSECYALFSDMSAAEINEQTAIKKLADTKTNQAEIRNDQNKKIARSAMVIMVSTSLAAVLIAVALGLYLSSSMSRSFNKVLNMFREMSKGHFQKRLTIRSKDEIGKIGQAMDDFCDTLSGRFIGNLEKVAAGDLRFDMPSVDDKDELVPPLLKIRDNLQELVEETTMLTEAAVNGELDVRGNADRFSGSYQDIVAGINSTLDAVVAPIRESSEVLQNMAEGKLSMRVTGDYRGEYAKIKTALNGTLDAMSAYISEIAQVLGELAENSNLNVQIEQEFKGDFEGIKHSINYIIYALNRILSKIHVASQQVAAGAEQISDSSQSLAQGATEQASAVEQLTASLEEVAVQTKLNAEHAGEANHLAKAARTNAATGNEQMKQMLTAMEEINTASNSISKIIRAIDDIAFQTNILALNAAVEAARAGQHGRGFTVVAEEVRNLAAKSAQAAKETGELISNSIQTVKSGTKIAQSTAGALDEIVSGVSQVAQIVGDIATSSNEQSAAIEQINRGVSQVSQVVQSNSATSEETAAASEELYSQSEFLKNLIAMFRLREKSDDDMTDDFINEQMKQAYDVQAAEKRREWDESSAEGSDAGDLERGSSKY